MAAKKKSNAKNPTPPAAIIGRTGTEKAGFLTTEQKAALAAAIQLISQHDYGKELPAQEYDLEGTRVIITLGGAATKRSPHMYTPTTSIPHKAVLERMIVGAGAVGSAVANQIFSLLRTAMEEVGHGKVSPEDMKKGSAKFAEVKEAVEKGLKTLPPRERAGRFEAPKGFIKSIEVTAPKLSGVEESEELEEREP